MPDCNHEEADTNIVVHLRHALNTEDTVTALVRTVDTDVVAILVGKFYDMKAVNPDVNILVAFGMGRNFKFLGINRICASLGLQKSRSLPVFHAITGCDTTSALYGKGKRSAWQAWVLCNDNVTPTLEFLATHPFQQLNPVSTHFHELERMTIVIELALNSINDVRMDLFCSHNRAIDNIPPTQVSQFRQSKK
jgi:hypothetical protein